MTSQGAERLLKQAATYQRLAETGLATVARVLGVRTTGGSVDGDPQLELELAVEIDGRQAHVRLEQVVSRLAARELQIGDLLPVHVDPLDPTVVALA